MRCRAELRPSLDARLKELGLSTLFMPSAHSTADGDSDLWSQTGTKVTTEAVCAGIFAAMCCGEPLVACRLALAHRMSHLASCLSMAPISDPLCKRGLKKQIIVWNELKVLPFMPRDVLRTYALLAGEIQVPLKASSCNEGTKQTATTLNVLAGLPYIQALGVHLWYIVDHSDDLANALKLFSHNWHAQNLEVAPPQPPRDSELMHENADKVIIRGNLIRWVSLRSQIYFSMISPMWLWGFQLTHNSRLLLERWNTKSVLRRRQYG